MMKLLTCLLSLLSLSPLALSMLRVRPHPEVNGMFVFGSSLVDNGNNNFLNNTTAKANFSPYGIDFLYGPSGRFSNGQNSIDVLGRLLKLPTFIPPFNDPTTRGRSILHGVNFASGGSGILESTGPQFSGEVMSMDQQIKHLKDTTLPELGDMNVSQDQLSKYLFVVGTGGNDYVQNYFVSEHKDTMSLQEFTQKLVSVLSAQLKQLYELGARKFVLFSVQALGCYPVVRERVKPSNGGCVEAFNEAAVLFNSHLKSLATTSMHNQMPNARFVFIDSYKIIRDIMANPVLNGFLDTSRPCCEVENNGILCKRGGRVCGDRDAYVYFDGLHPTEAVNARIAEKAYYSKVEEEAYPTNVRELASL